MLARRKAWPVSLCIHRSRTYRGEDSCLTEGLRHTGVPRTIIDLVGTRCGGERDLVAETLLRNLTTTGALFEALELAGRAPGTRELRAMLAAIDPSVARARSRPEARILSLLKSAGLPAPVVNHEIRNEAGRLLFELDFAYPEWMLGYEYDSDAFHSTPSQLHRDRQRDRRLAALGWDIRHLSSADLRTPRRLTREVSADIELARSRSAARLRVSRARDDAGSGHDSAA